MRLIFPFIGILLAVGCNNPSANFFEPKKGKDHTIDRLKLSLNDYQWEVKEDAYGVPLIIMRPQKKGDDFIESISIQSKFAANETYISFNNLEFNALHNQMGVVSMTHASTDTIDGVLFKKTIFNHKPKDDTLSFIMYNGVKGNIGYSINAVAKKKDFSYYQKQLEAIIHSITFNQTDSKRYYNSLLGISIVNKANWEIKEGVENIPVFFLSPEEITIDGKVDFQENINIVSEPIGNLSLEEYYEGNMKGINQYITNFQLISKPKEVTINDHLFKTITYTHSADDVEAIVLVYFTVYKGKGFVFNASSDKGKYSIYKPIFEDYINTFQFEY